MRRGLDRVAAWSAWIAVAAVFTLAWLFLMQIRWGIPLPNRVFGLGMVCMFVISVFGIHIGTYELVRGRRSKVKAARMGKFTILDPRFDQFNEK
jgi:hypothetical protein